jgi:hypothetical protein
MSPRKHSRNPLLPLPQYNLKQSDFKTKKSWQSARARKAGFSSYADWIKKREEARNRTKKPHPKGPGGRTPGKTRKEGKYWWYTTKNMKGFDKKLQSLSPDTNIMVLMKREEEIISLGPKGRAEDWKGIPPEDFLSLLRSYADSRSKKSWEGGEATHIGLFIYHD